jgi:hypothetical protein
LHSPNARLVHTHGGTVPKRTYLCAEFGAEVEKNIKYEKKSIEVL